MPEKPLTVATYAAGASLAAIALVFVFAPTFCIDGEESGQSSRARKKGVVGLFNPANDCFINSVLQSLAGLGELRTYLIRECHRRALEQEVYETASPAGSDQVQALGLQQGILSQALKEVLDKLNERPIYKKTITAGRFVAILERGFNSRISRQQQDAQEFLQVVAERLSDEYHAGVKARARARVSNNESESESEKQDRTEQPPDQPSGEEGFPFEGTLATQIECQTCHFKPKPRLSTFVTLTLHIPHDAGSTTLSHCFDMLLKTEYIEDFKCDKCRLTHAHSLYSQQLRSVSSSAEKRDELRHSISLIEKALDEDPENPPSELALPPLSAAPPSKIARHAYITAFPRIAAIHLSRSVYTRYSASSKNSAKVSFPERLPLGGLLNQRHYRLRGVVTHRGSHNSGHYESFRRQTVDPPYSTPDTFKPSEAYTSSPTDGSPARSPVIRPRSGSKNDRLSSSGSGSGSGKSEDPAEKLPPPTSAPQNHLVPKKRVKPDRWWRISDDKIKEARTKDVLGMQREVYLLFYEMERS